jgi:O-antigen/teichoic acid export membrane protein
MRIRTRSVIIALSQTTMQVVAFVVGVLLVRMVSKETLGTYRQVFMVQGLLAGMLSLQLGNSLYYFLPRCSPDQQRGILAQTLAGSMGLAGLIGAAMFVLAGTIAHAFANPALAGLLQMFALFPFIDKVQELLPAYFISQDRVVRASFYSVAMSLSRAAVVVVGFAAGWGLPGVLKGVLVAGAAVAAVGLLDMAATTKQGRWAIQKALLLEQFRFAWPLWATGLVGILNAQFDRLLISTTFDAGTYAVYTCGAMEIPLLGIITNSLTLAMMPQLVSYCHGGKPEAALGLWHHATRKAALIIFPAFAMLMVCGPDLILMLYGPAYSMAAWAFAISLLRLPVNVAIYATLFQASGQTRPVAIGALLGLVTNVVFGALLTWAGRGSLLSFLGPTLGWACSCFVYMPYMLLRLSKLTRVPFSGVMRWKELGRILLVSGIGAALVLIVPVNGPAGMRVLIKCALYGACTVLAFLLTGTLSQSERSILLLPLIRLRRLRAK